MTDSSSTDSPSEPDSISIGRRRYDERPTTSTGLTQLHNEVKKFSETLEMDSEELKRKRELIQIWKAFKEDYPFLKVEPFGGYANGLAAKMSDVDIVLAGMYSPDGDHGGYSYKMRNRVNSCLQRLRRELKLPLKRSMLISQARIPLLKLTTEDGIELDVSIGNHSGPEAARFIKQKVDALPQVRPLVLVVKYMLKAVDLNDVSKQGLGTYALANMAIAYVQYSLKLKLDVSNYGDVLLGFLRFYGIDFDLKQQAVSLRNGNICEKMHVVLPRENPWREKYLIEDYFTGYSERKEVLSERRCGLGYDISGGTNRVEEIRTLFRSAYDSLVKYRKDPPVKEKNTTSMFPYLSKFIDVRLSAPMLDTIEIHDSKEEIERNTSKKRTDRRESSEGNSRRKERRRSDHESRRNSIKAEESPARMSLVVHQSSRRQSVSLSEVMATAFIRRPSNRLGRDPPR